MSWDVFFQDLPKDAKTIEDISDTFIPEALCTRKEVLDILRTLFPNINFNDPEYFILREADYSIEFYFGKEETIESLALFIRGSESSISAIQKIIEYTNWRGIDSTSGDILDSNNCKCSGHKIHNEFLAQIANSRTVL